MAEEINKGFAQSKKLTEGDNAFQQYDMENKDRVGSSTPPIDIVEPPVKLEKADISTMAPNEQIGENNIDKPIKYDNPVDKVKKDYSGGVAFSTQHQIPGEMSNAITPPEKVNVQEENRKHRNAMSANKEPYCWKEMDNESFYNSIDELLYDDEPVAKDLADKIEKGIYISLKKSMNSWFVDIDKNMSVEDALVSLRKSLQNWNINICKNADTDFNTLFSLGIRAGIRKSMVPVSEEFRKEIDNNLLCNNTVTLVTKDISDKVFSKMAKIIKSYSMGSYKQKMLIDTDLRSIQPVIQSMVQSELSRFGNLGFESVKRGDKWDG